MMTNSSLIRIVLICGRSKILNQNGVCEIERISLFVNLHLAVRKSSTLRDEDIRMRDINEITQSRRIIQVQNIILIFQNFELNYKYFKKDFIKHFSNV